MRPVTRRALVGSALGAGSLVVASGMLWPAAGQTAAPATTGAAPNGFLETIVERARALAAADYVPPDATLPEPLAAITYDDFRRIRFRPEHALWLGEDVPFQVQFFHRGWYFKTGVVINVVDGGAVTTLPFDGGQFDYGEGALQAAALPADLGFAGFRFHAPMNRPDYYDEVAVFLGASYFRAIGRGQVYGLSARGLAIDTALAKPEEFPSFREFWIEKPTPGAASITVHALLDSDSVAGAYRFVITPGQDTVVQVAARLFMRRAVERLGIAPLTSMFLHGENSRPAVDDYRPEVHDSDGLMIAAATGEWLWRPLRNPAEISTAALGFDGVRGFGLLQRDRDFRDYQDLEAVYQLRPSAWVEPEGDWGRGEVVLVEIPIDREWYDNIVAFWVPEAPTAPGQVLAFDYRLHWVMDQDGRPPGGRVVATREAKSESVEGARRLLIDFAGPNLAELEEDAAITAEVWASSGTVGEAIVHKNRFDQSWRVFFDLVPGDEPTIELRCFLRRGDDYLTETWSYRWQA